MVEREENWVIVGAGFRGLVVAYLLAKNGKKVTIVDSAKEVGGILYAKHWQGFDLDIGCHVFDNDTDETTNLTLEILDNEVNPSFIKYASFFNNQKTNGISIPDLSSLGQEVSQKILWETLETATKTEKRSITLLDKFSTIHGTTAAKIIEQLMTKTHAISIKEIDSNALNLTTYKRIKFTSDEMGRFLKKNPILDNKIAVSSQENPMEFYQEIAQSYARRNFYPNKNGTRLFCEKSKVKLEQLSVNLLLGKKVEKINVDKNSIEVLISGQENPLRADYLLWASSQELIGDLFGIENKLKDFVYPVPLILYYFTLDEKFVSDYSYIHNFDTNFYTFRASIPTNYGTNNAPKGKAYVCCEVPCKINSAIWSNPEAYSDTIWEEIKDMGIVSSEAICEGKFLLKTPVSYKLPKVGYSIELERVLSFIPQERTLGLEDWELTKNSIIKSISKTIKNNL
ncbi:MAG: NAD(P)-binding protein [Thermonemataceae bacterium]|nr:NAD(P)-binding protein [Thermonemataceae bacterium]